jgi:hypothetical protein
MPLSDKTMMCSDHMEMRLSDVSTMVFDADNRSDTDSDGCETAMKEDEQAAISFIRDAAGSVSQHVATIFTIYKQQGGIVKKHRFFHLAKEHGATLIKGYLTLKGKEQASAPSPALDFPLSRRETLGHLHHIDHEELAYSQHRDESLAKFLDMLTDAPLDVESAGGTNPAFIGRGPVDWPMSTREKHEACLRNASRQRASFSLTWEKGMAEVAAAPKEAMAEVGVQLVEKCEKRGRALQRAQEELARERSRSCRLQQELCGAKQELAVERGRSSNLEQSKEEMRRAAVALASRAPGHQDVAHQILVAEGILPACSTSPPTSIIKELVTGWGVW